MKHFIWWPLLITIALCSLVACVKQPFLFKANAPANTVTINPQTLRQEVAHLTEQWGDRSGKNPAVLNQVANYLQHAFLKHTSRVEMQAYQVNGQTYYNVIARFGPTQGAPLVIGAHYDTHENTVGADDNASGTVGLLALAHLLAENAPTIPVEIVAYTLEEPPFYHTAAMGSRVHAARLGQQGIKPRLAVVLEMIGYFDDRPQSQRYPVGLLASLYPSQGDFIAVVGNFGGGKPTRLVKSAMRAYSPLPVESINAPSWVTGVDFSDHSSYWLHNMPAVMVTDTAFFRNPHYHQPTDAAETLDYTRMAHVIAGVYGVVKSMETESNVK